MTMIITTSQVQSHHDPESVHDHVSGIIARDHDHGIDLEVTGVTDVKLNNHCFFDCKLPYSCASVPQP